MTVADNIEQPLNLTPYTGVEFFDALADDISATQAGDRASLATMSLEPQETAVRRVLDGLGGAALRGSDVTLAVDAYTFMYPRGLGPLAVPLPLGRAAIQRRSEALETLTEVGAKVNVINQPRHRFSGLYNGRSHLKINVINDKIYLGGPSLHGTERSDMVVGFEHAGSANWLHRLTTDITEAGNTKDVLGQDDQIYTIDDKTKILVDAGKRNQSLVLDEALGLIDDAEDWLIIGSQYFPVGVTGKRLLEAHKRGVEVYIAYNHPSKHDRLTGIHKAILALQRLRTYPEEFFDNQLPVQLPKLHAKVLASERAAMVGSHNYVNTGVRLGTPEMTVIQHEPTFALSVRNLLLQQVRLLNVEKQD